MARAILLAAQGEEAKQPMIEREELHVLIDQLPDKELRSVRGYLRYLAAMKRDPVLRALVNAPVDNEPETEEERLAVEEARKDLEAGRVVSHEEARRRLLGKQVEVAGGSWS